MVLRNNKKYLIQFICIVSISLQSMLSGSYAQDIPASSNGKIVFYLDQASFAGMDGNSIVEFYLMFYADQILKFSKISDQKSELSIQADIYTTNENKIVNRKWITEVSYNSSLDSSSNKVIYDQWKEELKPGDYKIIVEIFDKSGKTVGKAIKKFYVPQLETNIWDISDIQLISSVQKSKIEDEYFNKGNFKVIPNPSRRFGILIPVLYLYFEIYDTDSNSQELFASYTIEDQQHNIIKSVDNNRIKTNDGSTVVVNGINVSSIKTGIYNLKGIIRDNKSNKYLSFNKRFEIIQADFFESTPFLTDEQASIFETILTYIGTEDQLKLYESLSTSGKAQFVIQYWKNLDLDPSTQDNEYLIEIQKRFNYAKNKLGSPNINGWETDRGRICIKYGIPNQIDQYNTEAETDPYEIWTYNEEKTYKFIFADLNSNGKYVLLHSTKEEEIYNDDWQELIRKL